MQTLTALVVLSVLAFQTKGQYLPTLKHGLAPIGPPQTRAKAPVLETVRQPWDHFDSSNEVYWNQRYYSNDQFATPGGPIFIMIGGEWEIKTDFVMGGLLFDIAAENQGYLYYLEHRHYGGSHPTSDLSTENLKHLTTEQAIADLASFIELQKEKPGRENSKVVVAGGSYSATLATWARLKYPQLIDAAWASSAPLRATIDFKEYYVHMAKEINRADAYCFEIIEKAMVDLRQKLQTEAGVASMSSLFNTCKQIDVTEPAISYFYGILPIIMAQTIQYADGSGDIKDLCMGITYKEGTPLEKVAMFIREKNYGRCLGDLQDVINVNSNSEITNEKWNRQWLYLCCTETGWTQTGTGDQPFGHFNFALEVCDKLFNINNSSYVAAIDRTNSVYGSVNINITKLISVHGSIDPWQTLGLTADLNDEAPVIIVPDYAHTADLSSILPYDTADMVRAKTSIKNSIRKWISSNWDAANGTLD